MITYVCELRTYIIGGIKYDAIICCQNEKHSPADGLEYKIMAQWQTSEICQDQALLCNIQREMTVPDSIIQSIRKTGFHPNVLDSYLTF